MIRRKFIEKKSKIDTFKKRLTHFSSSSLFVPETSTTLFLLVEILTDGNSSFNARIFAPYVPINLPIDDGSSNSNITRFLT